MIVDAKIIHGKIELINSNQVFWNERMMNFDVKMAHILNKLTIYQVSFQKTIHSVANQQAEKRKCYFIKV